MKRLTTALVLSLLAATGCKHDSAKATPTAAEQAAERGGPLVTPNGPGLGGAADTPAERTAARVARERGRGGPDDRDGGGGPRGWIGGADLTPEELAARRAENQQRREARRQDLMATFDADKDGVLSPEERKAMHDARVAEMVDRLDTDRDGKLSKSEVETILGLGGGRGPIRDFTQLDLDQDGFVTTDEMAQVMPQRGPRGRDDFRGSGAGLRGDQTGPTAPDEPPPHTPAPQ